MARQQAGEQKPIDGSIWALIFGLTILFVYIFWMIAHEAISTAYSWVRIVEFAPFVILKGWWIGGAGALLMVTAGPAYFVKFHRAWTRRFFLLGFILAVCGLVGWIYAGWFNFFLGSNKALIEWGHIFQSSIVANVFTWLVFVVPIAVISVKRSLTNNPLNEKHYAKTKDYSLHTFTDEMGIHYPHLRLFRKIDLTKRSVNEGWYRMADTEKQFAMKNSLLDRARGKRSEFKVDRDLAAEAFRGQMGKMWSGFNQLGTWELAIMALLMPRIAATDPKMDDAEYKIALDKTIFLTGQYWNFAADSYDAKSNTIKFDLKEAAATVRMYKSSLKVQRFFDRHAYVSTIIYSMLNEARSLGVLAAADLRWLRVADRRLWLLVDNVGRITAFPEISGIYSHYLHELKTKRAIERPMIDGAITALIRAVDEVAFSEDETIEINSKMDAEMAAFIDPSAKAEKQTLFLAARTVIDAKPNVRDIFDVAVISQSGAILYQTQCKPMLSAELIQAQYGLSNEDIDQLATMPNADAARKKILEIVNGHDVVVFDVKKEKINFPGIERSAVTVVSALKESSDFDLFSTAINEGVIEPGDADMPKISSASDAATLVRMLWESERKDSLLNQAAALKNTVGATT